MIIYLDQYRTTKGAAVGLKNGTYGDETLNSNLNPAAIYRFNGVAQDTISPELPEDMAKADVEEFLSRVYALATQI